MAGPRNVGEAIVGGISKGIETFLDKRDKLEQLLAQTKYEHDLAAELQRQKEEADVKKEEARRTFEFGEQMQRIGAPERKIMPGEMVTPLHKAQIEAVGETLPYGTEAGKPYRPPMIGGGEEIPGQAPLIEQRPPVEPLKIPAVPSQAHKERMELANLKANLYLKARKELEDLKNESETVTFDPVALQTRLEAIRKRALEDEEINVAAVSQAAILENSKTPEDIDAILANIPKLQQQSSYLGGIYGGPLSNNDITFLLNYGTTIKDIKFGKKRVQKVSKTEKTPAITKAPVSAPGNIVTAQPKVKKVSEMTDAELLQYKKDLEAKKKK